MVDDWIGWWGSPIERRVGHAVYCSVLLCTAYLVAHLWRKRKRGVSWRKRVAGDGVWGGHYTKQRATKMQLNLCAFVLICRRRLRWIAVHVVLRSFAACFSIVCTGLDAVYIQYLYTHGHIRRRPTEHTTERPTDIQYKDGDCDLLFKSIPNCVTAFPIKKYNDLNRHEHG